MSTLTTLLLLYIVRDKGFGYGLALTQQKENVMFELLNISFNKTHTHTILFQGVWFSSVKSLVAWCDYCRYEN